jgi:hypothetical protein
MIYLLLKSENQNQSRKMFNGLVYRVKSDPNNIEKFDLEYILFNFIYSGEVGLRF